MLRRIAKIIRQKFHPLWYLRQYKFFRILQRCLDIPIYVNLPGINWKIRVRLLRQIWWIVDSESYEPGIKSLILAINDVLKPKVFWDIGANVGYYSWLLMSQNKEIEVILFEPDPVNAVLLKDTIDHAKLQNVQLIVKAVSDKDGEDTFLVDNIAGVSGALRDIDQSGGGNKFLYDRYGISKTITVKTIKIDSINNLKLPDLIKIDAEGAENKIIKGGMEIIRKKQPVIIVEVQCSPDRSELISQLSKLNYELFNADNINGALEEANNLLAMPYRYRDITKKLFQVYYERLKIGKSKMTNSL